jgi:hypothetical protein
VCSVQTTYVECYIDTDDVLIHMAPFVVYIHDNVPITINRIIFIFSDNLQVFSSVITRDFIKFVLNKRRRNVSWPILRMGYWDFTGGLR